MNIDVRIALQNFVYNKLHITIPNHTRMLDEFEKLMPELIPQTIEEVEPFFTNHYAKFVEPIPGLIRSHSYDAEKLKADGFTLEPLDGSDLAYDRYYVDPKTKTYWIPKYVPRVDIVGGYYFQGFTRGSKLGRT